MLTDCPCLQMSLLWDQRYLWVNFPLELLTVIDFSSFNSHSLSIHCVFIYSSIPLTNRVGSTELIMMMSLDAHLNIVFFSFSTTDTLYIKKMMKIEWTLFLLFFFFFLFTPSSSSHVGHHVPSHHHHYHHESLSSLTPSPLTSFCPSICSCKWKSGKKTVSCINVSLKDLPTGIESDTQVLHMNDNDLSESLSKPIFAEYGLTNLQRIFLSR